MTRRPPTATRTDPLFPEPTLCRSGQAARKTQHVGQRLGLAGIRPHAAAAEGGAAARVVNGDDGLQAAQGIVTEDDLLVAVEFPVLENGHGNLAQCAPWRCLLFTASRALPPRLGCPT